MDLNPRICRSRCRGLMRDLGSVVLVMPRAMWDGRHHSAVRRRVAPQPVRDQAVALKELRVPIDVKVPEPNTWRELLRAIDPVRAGLRVAVQEYGKPNLALIQGLRDRRAHVTPVPVYQWELPEDTGPLRQAIRQIAEGRADVVLFTTSVQVPHLFAIAVEMQLEELLRKALIHVMVASIGPISSETLLDSGVHVDMEPSHPKMGVLVREAAEQSAGILAAKRRRKAAEGSHQAALEKRVARI